MNNGKFHQKNNKFIL